ncbi:MAG: hypothetical protein UX75_C0005G0022 [Candidatus Moranbacteria bacterium GW2011_GWE2_47_10]|nr:MAG: hypothetical protein UW87_C0016G0016 [Candidatus Moranbacteria bacterium GW2011_GWC2_45_10]KKT94355.1 MAG: hypothetical protein UW95_C0016G0028 [Parcubacteria group bacterium GW2011_GWC1_45_14]KKU55493.1 MAG: hypothetical protein UX75_C0005G0022 [Candidatus Moranbacteria bacterium GW2011_GWE2_47_10]
MSKVSENVLGDIRKNSIRPTCRLYFVVREILFWVFYVAILLFGAFIFAGILELLFGRNFEAPSLEIIFERFLSEVPLYWLLILVFFLFAGLYVNRRTKGSYRFQKRIILIGETLIVFLLGIILYFLEAGLFACEVLGK